MSLYLAEGREDFFEREALLCRCGRYELGDRVRVIDQGWMHSRWECREATYKEIHG